MEFKPLARSSEIVVQKVSDETLVYNLKTHKAQCLNETSAMVWELCDGTRTVAEITTELSEEFETQVDQDLVRLALGQLQKEGLLESNEDNSFLLKGPSRRQLLRKIGFATAIALPLVSSIIAPTAQGASTELCLPGTVEEACECGTLANNGVQNCLALDPARPDPSDWQCVSTNSAHGPCCPGVPKCCHPVHGGGLHPHPLPTCP
ncbi:MAG: hypothetical protein ETSY1_42360 [Candidatus Entotheonella factor]|uniref:PqqD family protein n=1 Tax=Entotheonella factor TaxID=1429438 RepID=W4L4B6_ENTF1|nr:MAG: hypothetical protein ETSY1_42360 [Candidatus Entotheonella factor]